MKIKLNPDKELVKIINQKLKDNDGYCPCILGSKGKKDYKCMCKNFREQNVAGECHCGKFIKVN